MNNLDLLALAMQQTHAAMVDAAVRAGKDPRRNAHVVRVGVVAHAATLMSEGRGDAARRVLQDAVEGA